jgi:uncharacterized membrane protein YeaQ/YmgE (transglycosylase-associated protein family)
MENIGILSWIILGLIAGVLGKFIMPGKDGGGLIKTILLGIIGALLGGIIGTKFLNIGTVTSAFDLKSIAIATAGSVLVLIIYRFVKKNT